MKAPRYNTKGFNPATDKFVRIRELAESLAEYCPPELVSMLNQAICDLEQDCCATSVITRGGTQVGFGLNKSRKAISCDTLISIVREIKAIKSW